MNINLLVLNPSITYCFTVHLTLDSNLDKGVKDNHIEGNTINQCNSNGNPKLAGQT